MMNDDELDEHRSEEQAELPDYIPGGVARVAVLAALLTAPWLTGMGASIGFCLAAVVGVLCWSLTPELSTVGRIAVPPTLIWLLLGAFWLAVQLVPQPPSTLALTSPLAHRWWGLLNAADQASDPSGLILHSSSVDTLQPIALYPLGGREALARFMLGTAFFMVGARFFRNRFPFVWVAVGLGLLTLTTTGAGVYARSSSQQAAWILHLVRVWQEAFFLPVLTVAAGASLLASVRSSVKGSPTNAPSNAPSKGHALFGVVLILVGGVSANASLNPIVVTLSAASAAAVVASVFLAGRLPRYAAILIVVGSGAILIGSAFTSGRIALPPERWQPLTWTGAGGGATPLLATDGSLAGESLVEAARVWLEAGWPGIILLLIFLGFFTSAIGRLHRHDAAHLPFAHLGVGLAVGMIGWLFWSDQPPTGWMFSLSALLAGSAAGRAALVTRHRTRGAYYDLPTHFSAPLIGALMLAGVLWASYQLAVYDARPATPWSMHKATLDELDAELARSHRHSLAGNTTALARNGEIRIHRFRLQTAESFASSFAMQPDAAWHQSNPDEIFSRARQFETQKASRELAMLRNERPVTQNLPTADGEFRAALRSSPLVADVALRVAQLRFANDAPTNEKALLDLAGERASVSDGDFLYRLGLQEYFADRMDLAKGYWRAALTSPRRPTHALITIAKLSAAKLGGEKTLREVLPNHPEAYLTFAESVVPANRAIDRVLAYELAKAALSTQTLPGAERAFQEARWSSGTGNAAMALAGFRKAVELEPSNPRYLLTLSRALEAAGDREAALETAERCLQLYWEDEEARATVKRLKQPPQRQADPPKNNPPQK